MYGSADSNAAMPLGQGNGAVPVCPDRVAGGHDHAGALALIRRPCLSENRAPRRLLSA